MNGPGRRGRRGGRRQRRREEQARQQAAVLPAPAAVEPVIEAARELEVPAPVDLPAPVDVAAPVDVPAPAPQPAPAHAADPAHPRPMSARELVARLEAKHAQEAHAEAAADDAAISASAPVDAPADVVAAAAPAEPRRFAARGVEWLASLAGRGSGGTGRVAQARIDAIRFATVSEPETVAAEVIVPRVRLDDLYDDELAELLERGLRSKGTD